MQHLHANDNPAPIATREELIRILERLSRPLDLDQLVKDGVLQKSGSWYLVKGPLPKHARARVKAIRQTARGVYLRFPKPSKALARLAKRLHG